MTPDDKETCSWCCEEVPDSQLRETPDSQGAPWAAVADWLDAAALVLDVAPDRARVHALRVARAYLGESD